MILTKWMTNKVIKICRNIFIQEMQIYENEHPKGCIKSNNNLNGKYLVNFKKAERGLNGPPWHNNDLLPASVTPYKNKLYIKWDNGYSCVINHSYCNFKVIENGTNHSL